MIFLFFSKSGSKLVPYILPIFPPLAILVANRFSNIFEGRAREIKLAVMLLGCTLTLLGIAAVSYTYLPQAVTLVTALLPALTNPLRQFVTYAPAVSTVAGMAIGLMFLVQGMSLFGSVGRKPAGIVVVLCLRSFLLEILIPHLVMENIARNESPRELALKARSLAGPDTLIVTSGLMQAVSWYTERRVLVTGKPDELEFGSKQGDQSAWFPDREKLLKLWGEEKPLLLMLKKKDFEGLASQLLPKAKVIQESGRLMLIRNR